MSNKRGKVANVMVPGDIFHPGEHLKDETGLSKSEISLIIHGRRNITPNIAVKLELALAIKAEFWMNLQIKYDIDLIKQEYRRSLKKTNLTAARKAKIKKLIAAA